MHSKNKKGKALFYCGTSNVELPVPNKSHYPDEYKDKSRLHYYASLFNTVEINSTFYKIPRKQTIERWAADVPDDFLFSFKLWKSITHAKELVYDPADVARFMAVINGAGNKKGCLLLQLPASVKRTAMPRLRRLLDHLAAAGVGDAWKLAVEYRDKSWYDDTTYEMLEQYRAAVVVHDMPASATPVIDMDAPFVYMRFHGQEGNYRGTYADDLPEYASVIKDHLKSGKPVFAYFNNTLGGAVSDAMGLKGML